MLKTRVITAVVILPALAVLAWVGHPWLTLFVAVALGLGAYEFGQLGRAAGHDVLPALPAVFAACLALSAGFGQGRYASAVLSLGSLALVIWYVFHAHSPTRTEAWAMTFLASVYVGFLGSHRVALRALPDGLLWLVLAIVTTWVSDTGAFLIGRQWGRRKLAPHLSPKKTWMGCLGGLVTAVGFAVPLAYWGGAGAGHGLAVGLLIGVVCPFGDLVISMVKRQVGVKDTGALFPGHGGMLDRLDTLLVAAPLIYYYAVLFALPG